MASCLICERIAQIKKRENPYFVAELTTGYIVLGDFQFYKGYTLFLSKDHVSELSQLKRQVKTVFLKEMAQAAEAVYKAFKPLKLNYELLGNSDPHLHWHLFPRYKNDPSPNKPVWVIDKSIRCSDNARPSREELASLKNSLLSELRYLKP